MTITFSEKFIAYLALFTGLAISIVAEYYSILGLTSIFSAAVVPVIIMGIVLGIGKITATIWLKQNWNVAPWGIKIYLGVAILVLMLITSMGIFGFLSKAHSDQSLVSGDVLAKISVYDEKIKTAKENIDANRKALKQMDEAVDQTMGRSTTEKGAERAVQIRRSQQKERVRLAQDIEAEQKKISQLMEERGPIAAEVRKVDAEVGPIKYIAQFVYGETEKTILEKAVTWVIIILIVVFDPLAVILLLASQISFQHFKNRENFNFELALEKNDKSNIDFESEIKKSLTDTEGDSPSGRNVDIVTSATTVTEPAPHHPDTHPYLRQGFKYPDDWAYEPPLVYKPKNDSFSSLTDIELPTVDKQLSIEEILKIEDSLVEEKSGIETIQNVPFTGEKLINYYADLVRTKKIRMADVPEHILLEVRARV